MKPISLNISGLNSFVQEEKIDFASLTERGLFGIFGPTGSGKSSILDAITIALYGEISRDTSEFINTETGELYVCFKFTAGSDSNYYTVERKMKLKDNGGYRTAYARLITDKDTDKQQIFDGVREIEDKINEIIGLNHEDFMRTVVLPQGKFSKFLKLTGRDRRDMLERILGLEQFGENLMEKLKKKIKIREDKLKEISGILNKYEDINNEKLKEESNKLNLITDKYKNITSKLDITQKQYETYQEVWKLQKSLQKYQEKQHSLLVDKDRISDIKQKLEQAKKANSIKADLERYERYNKHKEQTQKQLVKLKQIIEGLEQKITRLKVEYEEWLQQKDKELPQLVQKKIKLKEAQELKKETEKLNNDIKQKKTDIKNCKQHNEKLKRTLKDIEKNIKKLNSEINNREKRIEELQVTPDFRKSLNKGLELETEFKRNQKELQELQLKKQGITEEIKNIEENIDSNENTLVNLEKNIYLKYQQQLSDKTNHRQKLSQIKNNVDSELSSKQEELEQLEEIITEIKNQNMAAMLVETLEEGKPCPVCGAREHPRKQYHQNQDLSDKMKQKQKLKTEVEELKSKQVELTKELEILYTEIVQIKKEKDQVTAVFIIDCKQIDAVAITDIIDLKNKSIQQLKDNRNSIKEELIKLKENLKGKKDELQTIEKKYQTSETLVKQQEQQYCDLQSELEISGFQETLQIINEKDKKRDQLQKQLKQLRINSADKSKEREHKLQQLHKSETDLNRLQDKKEILKENFIKNQEDIKQKAGDRDPEKYLTAIKDREEELKQTVKEKQELLTKLKDDLSDKQGDVKAVTETLTNLDQEITELTKYLEEKLNEFEFASIAEARTYITDKNKIDNWQQEIEEFKQKKQDIENNIKRLEKELNNETITEEQWQQIKQDKYDLEQAQNNLQEQIGAIKNEIKKLEQDLKDKKKYKKSKNDVEHQLSLIYDINSLVRGKSFVEFVAIRQLRYIAKEASRRLMEITNNRYRLELAENGEFVICDNFNGGVKRDCNTLSGGETFLTSLALALALSSHIQLKGSSHMEFFFLDEGFGTLDANLLDIVMNSLEKLQDEELAVGIISHVEELKNRVPIKLMVKPAEPGICGSQVAIKQA